MAQTREPLIKLSPAGPSVPLNTTGPLTRAQLRERDACHFRFVKCFNLAVPAAGTARATYDILTVAKGTLVLEVNAVVVTAFTTSVTLTIGDGDSAAGFLASADIAPQNIGTISRSEQGGEAYALGRYYTAGDTIDIVVGGADAVVGKLWVEIVYAELERFADTDFD